MILLLRHGETFWNAEGRIQGQTESILNPRGERQALAMARLAAELAQREAGDWRLVSSPLGRARATAQMVADATGLAPDFDPRLAEVCLGEWEGRLRREVDGGGADWMFHAPGGETFDDLARRVDSFLADLPPEPGRRVIVVSHGITGRLIRGAYGGLSKADILAQAVPQDAVYRLSQGQVDRFDCEPVA